MAKSPAGRPWLSIIIPAYNESGRLGRSLLQVQDYARRSGREVEVVVVDDGSEDGTGDLVRRMAQDSPVPIRLLVNPSNRGKGYSVRRGMLEASGQVFLMSDADMSTPIDEADRLLGWVREGFDVVIGSRNMPDSVLSVSRAWKRRVMEKVFRAIRRRVMLSDIRDTQCGFKCFRAGAAREVFTRLRTRGFAFDCEALGLARRLGLRIKEVGVVWCDDADSRLRPVRDSVRMLLGLLAIRWRLRGHKRAAPPPRAG